MEQVVERTLDLSSAASEEHVTGLLSQVQQLALQHAYLPVGVLQLLQEASFHHCMRSMACTQTACNSEQLTSPTLTTGRSYMSACRALFTAALQNAAPAQSHASGQRLLELSSSLSETRCAKAGRRQMLAQNGPCMQCGSIVREINLASQRLKTHGAALFANPEP